MIKLTFEAETIGQFYEFLGRIKLEDDIEPPAVLKKPIPGPPVIARPEYVHPLDKPEEEAPRKTISTKTKKKNKSALEYTLADFKVRGERVITRYGTSIVIFPAEWFRQALKKHQANETFTIDDVISDDDAGKPPQEAQKTLFRNYLRASGMFQIERQTIISGGKNGLLGRGKTMYLPKKQVDGITRIATAPPVDTNFIKAATPAPRFAQNLERPKDRTPADIIEEVWGVPVE